MAARVYTEVFPLAAQSNGYLHNAGQKNNTHTIPHTVTFACSPTVHNFAFGFTLKKTRKFGFQSYMIRRLWVNYMYRYTGGPPHPRVIRSKTYGYYLWLRKTADNTQRYIT